MKSWKGLRLRTSRRNPLKVTLVEADMSNPIIITVFLVITMIVIITITFAVGTQEWSRMLGPR